MVSGLNEKGLAKYRCKDVGCISQFSDLIPTLTVMGNVNYAASLVKKPRSPSQILKLLGLQGKAALYPDKLTKCERQRVAIAMALIKDPHIFLCDEPTGELDFNTQKRILGVLHKINQRYKKTVIIATNNPLIEQIADRVIRLLDGEIIEDRRNTSPIDPQELIWQEA